MEPSSDRGWSRGRGGIASSRRFTNRIFKRSARLSKVVWCDINLICKRRMPEGKFRGLGLGSGAGSPAA